MRYLLIVIAICLLCLNTINSAAMEAVLQPKDKFADISAGQLTSFNDVMTPKVHLDNWNTPTGVGHTAKREVSAEWQTYYTLYGETIYLIRLSYGYEEQPIGYNPFSNRIYYFDKEYMWGRFKDTERYKYVLLPAMNAIADEYLRPNCNPEQTPIFLGG